jgi:hypothetical protein
MATAKTHGISTARHPSFIAVYANDIRVRAVNPIRTSASRLVLDRRLTLKVREHFSTATRMFR